MADDQFQAREKGYSAELSEIMATFFTNVVEGDGIAKDAAAERVERALNAKNIKFKAGVDIPGLDGDLVSTMSVPRVTVQNLKPVLVKQATLKTSMNVNARQESDLEAKAAGGFEGKGSFGFGLAKVGIKIHGSSSVSSSHKRSSDYRSTVDVEAIMEQSEEPEGLLLIMDAMNKTVVKGLDIADHIIEAKAKALLAKADDKVQSGDLETPDVDTGDDGEDNSDDSNGDSEDS